MKRVSASLAVVMLTASGHPVTTSTLRSWVHRGHITRGPGGYDLHQILTYIEHRETRMTKYHSVLIEQKPTDMKQGARLMIDGLDIANATRSLSLVWGPDPLPTLTLELQPGEMAVELEQAKVVVDDNTREVLLKLGWTEPKAA